MSRDPGSWEQRPLADCGVWLSGGTPTKSNPAYWEGDIPWVGPKDLHERFIDQAEEYLTPEGIQNGTKVVPKDSILLVVRSMALANGVQISLTMRDVAFNQDIKAILPASDVDPTYLFYALWGKSKQLHQLVDEASHGTKRLRTDVLRDFTIPLPSLSEQREIAAIFGSLDKKIQSNRHRGLLLEQVAAVFFEAQFVDFVGYDNLVESEIGTIPNAWDAVTLGDISERTIGGVWGQDRPSAKAPIAVRCLRGIDIHHLANGIIPDVPIRFLSEKQLAKRRLQQGDILIEGSGSFCGRSAMVLDSWHGLYEEELTYSNFCKRLRPGLSLGRAAVAWSHLNMFYLTGRTASFRTGSAFPNLDVDGLVSAVRFALPPDEPADHYLALFKLAYDCQMRQQSRTISSVRDMLLPRLISGSLGISGKALLTGST